MGSKALSFIIAVSLCLPVPRAALTGQDMPRETGSITGLTIDAASGAPVVGATVRLLTVVPPDSTAWSRQAVTDRSGRYLIAGVPFGIYQVRVMRLGYRPAQVRITLAQSSPFRVSIAMEILPIMLEPEEITAFGQTFGDGKRDHEEDIRRNALRMRTTRYLETDVRVLTQPDLLDAATVGEADLFRAMQFLPGVASRDDYTAEIWTRGAPWSHTRVLFDGMPLYNPLHASGIFSGISPDVLGAAIFQPGGRSARLGEGAAGIVQLESRQAADTAWSGTAEVSPISARLRLDRRFAGGRGGIMVAGRRSYIDVLMSTVSNVVRDPGLQVPYAFADAAARLDLPLGSNTLLTLSGLFEQDQLRGDVRHLIRESEGTWGNMTGRVTLTFPIAGLVTTHTLGGTRFRGAMNIGNPFFEFVDSVPSHNRLDNRIDYAMWETVVQPMYGPLADVWKIGLQLFGERQLYDGPFPRPYPSHVVYDSLQITEDRSSAALWSEVRVSLADDISAELGLRLEAGDSMLERTSLAVYPTGTVRFTPGGGAQTFSASYLRSFQYTQAVAPAGPGIGPQLHLTDVWLLAGSNAPPISSTIVTVGTERRLGHGWLTGATVYSRVASGVAVPDPSPGQYTTVRPVFVSAINRATGVEGSIRKITGKWTGSMALSVGSSRIKSRSALSGELFEYPAASDRRVVMSGAGSTYINENIRIGATATLASGAPYTRFILETLPCDSIVNACPPPAGALTIEEPNVNRSATYASASAMAEWTKSSETWQLTVYLRLRNILNSRNAVTYAGSIGGCETVPDNGVAVTSRVGICDLFDRGLPILPLAGVSIAF